MDGILILIAIAVVVGLVIAWFRWNGAWESEPATPPRTKGQVGEIVANDAMGKVYSELGETRFWWRSHERPELFTLYMDIDQFAYIRRPRGLWDFEGVHEEARIQTRWRRQSASKRIWDAVQLVVPLAVKTAFRADSRIQTVRFHIGNMDMNDKIATCRVSVEAKRGEREDEWDWRYNRNAKGQLAPVNPHEDAPAPVRPRGFAADPYDFEMQVAQALQARGWRGSRKGARCRPLPSPNAL